jgi:bifunctional enzyme CysN/CysC
VDDGKSTLIGRLLYDADLIPDDQKATLIRESARRIGTDGELDFSLLVDGLEAEREQGITIDVAYRFFATPERAFIVADAPGHEQYTRNMATGASTAELAILLVDARKGLLQQTRRHARICSLLGIRHVVLAVNKIDLVGYGREIVDAIEADFRHFSRDLGFKTCVVIPVSARGGDNVVKRSPQTSWHTGPTLLEHLTRIDLGAERAQQAFRFPVQVVNRPHLDLRAFAGTVASGTVAPSDRVVVLPRQQSAQVKRIIGYSADLSTAKSGDAALIELDREIDVSRGDMLVREGEASAHVSDQFAAHVIWTGDQPLLPSRSYLFRVGTKDTPGTVTSVRYRLDVNTGEHVAARQLALNEIGFCHISTSAPVVFDAYTDVRATGSFIVIDRETNETVGAGMIVHALRRADNLHEQALLVGKEARAKIKHQRPAILWFTGLSGAGKSTIANLTEGQLIARGAHTYMLDGDNVRLGLNRDLGFTAADRVENIRRVGEVARLFVDSGLIVLCAFISPFKAERDGVRQLVGEGEFIEIFVDAPIDVCRTRDPKGLYAKADAGGITNFTGIDSPYEPPADPEIRLMTASMKAEDAAQQIVDWLVARGHVSA